MKANDLAALSDLRFDDRFVRTLPGDPETKNFTRQVYKAAWSPVQPTAVADPSLVALSPETARMIGLDPEQADPEALAEVFGGNRLLPGMRPYAACYGGHQFGHWAGQLGDGRAITLGERVHHGQRFELQLKGAGPTPYSRRADGRAVMRSSVREFLCSEAMHHLGVPTTRALTLVDTGDKVVRDMFYDGNAAAEPGAIVCRVAPSFLRFGSFEIFASRDDSERLKVLADDTLRTHFPELMPSDGDPTVDTYVAWLAEIARRTAHLMIEWTRVGFVHGVMNTDNMSILGLTIDYGPYGWLEGFDPNWTPNTTDAQGRRYRFGAQPQIGWWNMVRLAHALFPLVGEAPPLSEALEEYATAVNGAQQAMMAAKLGLSARAGDDALVSDLFQTLTRSEIDMTLFFRGLSEVPLDADAEDEALLAPLAGAWYLPEDLARSGRAPTLDWLRRYAARAREEQADPAERAAAMNRVNPKYVLRNYLAQLAIDGAEKGDSSRLLETLEVMRRPYDEQPGREAYAEKRPEWARHRPGCSMLSCSS